MTRARKPTGVSRALAEVERCAQEQAQDLRAERWLLVRELVILGCIAVLVVLLRSVTA